MTLHITICEAADGLRGSLEEPTVALHVAISKTPDGFAAWQLLPAGGVSQAGTAADVRAAAERWVADYLAGRLRAPKEAS